MSEWQMYIYHLCQNFNIYVTYIHILCLLLYIYFYNSYFLLSNYYCYCTLAFWQRVLQHALSTCLQSVVLLKLTLKILYAQPFVTNMLIIKNIKIMSLESI